MKTKIDIRRAITERGYTITSFCQKFDLKTQNIIQNYIKGNPTIKKLAEICEKLDCDITDLFYPIDGQGNSSYVDRQGNNSPIDGQGNNYPIDRQEKTENNGEVFHANKDEKEKHSHVNTENLINTTAFCPHCGAKVRVGVVLMTE